MFDGKIFVQHNGVAMGAPLAPIIADVFMAEFETTLMDRLEQKGVGEWHRYTVKKIRSLIYARFF